jgi:hypothetical protein
MQTSNWNDAFWPSLEQETNWISGCSLAGPGNSCSGPSLVALSPCGPPQEAEAAGAGAGGCHIETEGGIMNSVGGFDGDTGWGETMYPVCGREICPQAHCCSCATDRGNCAGAPGSTEFAGSCCTAQQPNDDACATHGSGSTCCSEIGNALPDGAYPINGDADVFGTRPTACYPCAQSGLCDSSC